MVPVSTLTVMWESFYRTFIPLFLAQLLTTVQAVTNVADVAHYAWWKAAILAAVTSAFWAAVRKVWPTVTDRQGAGRVDLPAARLPRR